MTGTFQSAGHFKAKLLEKAIQLYNLVEGTNGRPNSSFQGFGNARDKISWPSLCNYLKSPL